METKIGDVTRMCSGGGSIAIAEIEVKDGDLTRMCNGGGGDRKVEFNNSQQISNEADAQVALNIDDALNFSLPRWGYRWSN